MFVIFSSDYLSVFQKICNFAAVSQQIKTFYCLKPSRCTAWQDYAREYVPKKLINPKIELFLIYTVMRNFTFRKRLIAFAVSAFACLGANALEVSADGTTLIVTQSDASGLDWGNVSQDIKNKVTGENATVTTVKLTGPFTGWSGNLLQNGSSWASNIKTIDMSKADFSSIKATLQKENGKITGATKSPADATWSFTGFAGLKEVIWPEPGKIEVIPAKAFQETGLEEVTIPGYIKYIEQTAFVSASNDGYLKTIVFDEHKGNNGESDVEMYIAGQAFNNTYALLDVYIETEGTLNAAKDAFPIHNTYGHTDPKAKFTMLHFPEDKAEIYANPYPLTPADIETDGAFQSWLVKYNNNAEANNNGFFQFVTNGSTSKNGDNWGDVILRTFSHAKLDYIVPKGLKAFRVTNVTANEAGQYELTLTKTPVIPAGTGVILYGGPNSKDKNGNPTLAMTVVNYTGGKFGRDGGVMNLLMPTSYMDGETEVSGVDIKPYELDATGKKVEWRTFVMNKFSKTDLQAKYKKQYGTTPDDFVGFFRTKKGTISGGKAYLRLKANEFAQADGNEIIVPKFDGYRLEYVEGSTDLAVMDEDAMKAKGYWYKGSGDNITKIDWDEDWGVRNLDASFKAKFSGEPVFELDDEDEDGVVTLIVPGSMINGEEAGDYYNLQGVKVSHPTKGIYVKNGKKVVIK